MKSLLAAAALAFLLLPGPGRAQTPPAPAGPDATRQADLEMRALRRDLDALTKQVQALARLVADLTTQMVTSLQIDIVTEYFGGSAGALQPRVISAYPGNLVSASVMLVRTEREDAGVFQNGRSVVIAPGGSAAIPVEGADALCNWVIYDDANAIKVRSDGCSYLTRGLRGHFTGATYYRK